MSYPNRRMRVVSNSNANNNRDRMRARADQVAHWLDDAFEGPGGFRFGWDNIIGLIPGVGDLVTTLIGLYILRLAMIAGAPTSVLARMSGNIALDALVGAVPVLGDLFDVAIKSNRRNARLLSAYLDRPSNVQRRSRAWVAAVVSLIAVVLLSLIYGAWQVLAYFF